MEATKFLSSDRGGDGRGRRRRVARLCSAVGGAVASLAIVSQPAAAETKFWMPVSGNSNGSWGQAGHWSPYGVPVPPNDIAVFSLATDGHTAPGYTVNGCSGLNGFRVGSDKLTLNLAGSYANLSGDLMVGRGDSQAGYLTIINSANSAGPFVLAVNGSVSGGTSAYGRLQVNPFVDVTFTNNLRIGDAANATGAMQINGGKVSVGYSLGVGFFYNGTLDVINGGSITVGNYVDVGSGHVGAINLAGASSSMGVTGAMYLGGGLNGVGGSGTVTIADNAALKVTGDQFVGYSGAGFVTHTGGTHTVGQSLYIGRISGSSGSYNLSGSGSLSVSGTEYVGYSVPAAFTQTSGTHTVGSTLHVGYNSGSSGSYNLSGSGSLSVSGAEYIGYSGTGTFTQTGGTHTVGQSLYLGYNSGSSGSYTLSGGQLTAGEVRFGSGAGTRMFQLSGGTLSVSRGFDVTNGTLNGAGGAGVFNATGGIVNLGGGTLANTGQLTLNGSPSTLVIFPTGFNPATQLAGYVNPGVTAYRGSTIVIPAGTSIVGGATTLQDPVDVAGSLTTSSGGSLALTKGISVSGVAQVARLYTDGFHSQVTGSGSLSVSGTEYLGYNGSGTFTQTGGTHTVGSTLFLGYNPGSSGSYNLSGSGRLSVSGTDYVGYDGTGTFTQTGGTHAVQSLYLGYYSGSSGSYSPSGSYSLSGSSSLSVSGTEYVGYYGTGTFTQSGGTHTVGQLYLGYNYLSNGSYSLSGSGSLSVSGYEYVGNVGTGTFTQTGGTHTVGQKLFVGYNSSSVGRYILSGGTVSAGSAYIGGSDTAAGGIGSVTVAGGTFTVPGLLKVWNTGAATDGLKISGGAVEAGTLDLAGNTSRFMNNWTGGTLRLTGANQTVSSINASALGGSVGIEAGRTLDVVNSLDITSGTLTVNGGTVNVGGSFVATTADSRVNLWGGTLSMPTLNSGNMQPSQWNWSGGKLAVTGSGGIVIGSSGPIGTNISLGAGKTLDIAGVTTVAAGGSLTVADGSLRTGSLANSGSFSFTGGSVALTNSDLSVSSGGLLGGTVQLPAAKSLSVSGVTTIASGASVQVSGGSFTTGSLASSGSFSFTDGSLALTNSDLLIGSGGMLGSDVNLPPGKNLSVSGTTTVDAGSVLTLSGGNFVTGNLVNSGSVNQLSGTFSNSGTITHNGGTLQFGGVQNWAAGSALIVNGGSVAFFSDAGQGGANLAVNVQSPGSVAFNSSQHLANLSIGNGAAVTLAPGGGNMLSTKGLSIGAGAKLDLNDNDALFENVPFAQIQAWVLEGYSASGDSTKTGIVSGSGQGAGGTTILALFDNSLTGFPDYPFGSGQTIGGNAIVGKYTYIGDANYDGQVTAQDYTSIDANIGTSVPLGLAWFYGDTNFDGSIDATDYTGIDAALGLGQGNPLALHALAVPEGGSIVGVLGVGAGMMVRRRRIQG